MPLPRAPRLLATLLAALLAALLAECLPGLRAAEWDDLLATLGNLATVAGGPGSGADNPNEWNPAFEGGPALIAELSEPHMVMDDLWGNLYVADKNAHAIRKISPDGVITTVAGRHRFLSPNTGGYDGDGPGPERLLSFPNGLHVRADGTLYFVETGDSSARIGFPPGGTNTNSRIRRLDRDGTLTTLLTGAPLEFQRGLWVSPDEEFLYYTSASQLRRWDGAHTTVLADLSSASPAPDFANISVDRNGDVLVTDRFRHVVYRIPPGSVGLTNPVVVAGTGATDPTPSADVLARDGQPAISLPMEEVRGIGFHPLGGYVLACHKGGDLWYVDTAGNAHLLAQGRQNQNVLAGDGAPVTTNRSQLKLSEPRSITVGWNGDILFCTNDSGYIRVIRSNRMRPTVTPVLAKTGDLTWPGLAERWYFVETAPLPQGPWTTHTFLHVPVAGSQILNMPISNNTRGFYRVHETRDWP